jgi:hypothetical protein
MSIVNYGFGQGIYFLTTFGFGTFTGLINPKVDVELVCRILTSRNFTVSIETSFDNIVDMSN